MSTELVLRFIDALDAASVPYMLVGSFSSNYYGRPRMTKDADFVVVIQDAQLAQMAAFLGKEFTIDRQMSFETVTMTTRYIVHHPASEFKIEVFLLSDDAHDKQRFARRTQVPFEGRTATLPSPEDVIVTKLRWSKGGRRAKDVEDVAKVLAVRMGKLDLDYIRGWCEIHQTLDLFERLLAEAQKLEQK